MLKSTVRLVLISTWLVMGCSPAPPAADQTMPSAASAVPAPPPAASTTPPEAPIQKISVRGVELHYVDSGKTAEKDQPAIVFVHGSLADYREWEPVAGALAGGHRTIRYSRRYNHPNKNAAAKDHSAEVEAEDLAALIDALHLGPVHVVGASYGAYVALFLALRHPERVASMVLVEPPIVRWLPDLPDGKEMFQAFQDGLWKPASASASSGDDDKALRITMDFFVGPGGLDKLPPMVQEIIRANYPEWRALLLSKDAFPPPPRDQLGKLKTRVLMLMGEKTYPIAQLVDPALEKLLPNVERKIIPEGTHEMCSENPPACAEAIGNFLKL